MPLRIYDTLTREKREFVPVEPGRVRMYVCGMTVQNKPHVGHIRASLSGEVMRRYLEHLGYQVEYAYNFTDVDDKIIERANTEGIPYEQVSERNIRAYMEFADLCNIKRATIYPRATQHIAEMHALIARLIAGGHAYAAGGDVYFDVRSKADYGKLSGRRVDDMREGYRIEPGEAKRDPLDFALWKGAKPGEPAWESPWGPGRPGWHIECSAMAMKHLGRDPRPARGRPGPDLPAPRKRDRAERSRDRPAVFELLDRERHGESRRRKDVQEHRQLVLRRGHRAAGRSRGRAVLPAVDPLPLADRFHPRTTPRGGDRLRASALPAGAGRRVGGIARPGAGGELGRAVTTADQQFHEAMDDDFNTARALGHLFDLSRAVNRALDEGGGAEAREGARRLWALGSVLGLFWKAPAGAEWSPEVLALADQREAARKARDWKAADAFRDRLAELGAVVEDGPKGPTLKKKP